MQHHFGNPACKEHLYGGMVPGAVRQHVHKPGRPAVDTNPIVDCGPPQARGVCDRGKMHHEVRGSAERCVNGQRVLERSFRKQVLHVNATGFESESRAPAAARQIKPDGVPRRR
jgi:hypothetical protein